MESKLQVRILPEYPFGLAYGGLEMQCQRTLNELAKIAPGIKYLDYFSRADNFDLLHIFGNPPGLYEACYYAHSHKKIVISAVCGAMNISLTRATYYKIFSKALNLLNQRNDYERLRYMFQSASHIICLNSLEKQYIQNYYDINSTKISIIPNGVEKAFFFATSDLFIKRYGINDFVLYSGNIVKRKNPLLLAKVLSDMNIKGVFIGGVVGDEPEYVKQFEEIVNASPNLLWVKGLASSDPLLASAYAASKVVCLPSIAETQPQVALEAMALGKPVILADMPYAYQEPFTDVLRCSIDGRDSLVDCIHCALDNPEVHTHPLSDIYKWENIAKSIVDIYKRLDRDH
ncbi:MAG TPA: hypothetical protein DF296_02640 [Candidatus Margulisbacteria bacterium]|nr:MAG: hypothetical protein A2X43_05875 [Candidatus Margulisbacteria bacterium GWD2_39_127]HCT84077.1 hypothetical protein [Candidatus Margulisiibacteriota bacterium]